MQTMKEKKLYFPEDANSPSPRHAGDYFSNYDIKVAVVSVLGVVEGVLRGAHFSRAQQVADAHSSE